MKEALFAIIEKMFYFHAKCETGIFKYCVNCQNAPIVVYASRVLILMALILGCIVLIGETTNIVKIIFQSQNHKLETSKQEENSESCLQEDSAQTVPEQIPKE